MPSKDVVSILNDLIKTSKDGEQGFKEAATLVKSAELKLLLENFSQECGAAALELQECVISAGGFADNSGTALGAAHRGWMDLKTAAASNTEKAVLQECERGEDHAKASYEKALKADLPPSVRAIVARQYDGARKHHDRVRALRDQVAEA